MNKAWRKIVEEHGPSNDEERAILRAMDAIGQPTQEPWPGCPERSPSGRFYCCLPDCHEGYHRALAAEGDADLERWKPRYRYVRETYLRALWFRMETDHCAWERDVNGDWRIVEIKQ